MGRNTVVWRKLYKLSDQLQKLKPWEYIWSGDYICIELAPDDVVYCYGKKWRLYWALYL